MSYDSKTLSITEGLVYTRPNNRLQGMRGLACFRAEESLARRPRTPDPCVVRPLGKVDQPAHVIRPAVRLLIGSISREPEQLASA
jgi:hypothetical protein